MEVLESTVNGITSIYLNLSVEDTVALSLGKRCAITFASPKRRVKLISLGNQKAKPTAEASLPSGDR